MPKLRPNDPKVVNKGSAKNTQLQQYIKASIQDAQKKVDTLENEIHQLLTEE